MARKSLSVILSEPEITRLGQWLRAGSTPQQVALRTKIILRASQGQSDQQIARELKLQRRTSALWRRRVRLQGIGCVWEIAAGRGRKSLYGKTDVTRIVEATLQSKPKGLTHWSTRTLARAQGVSKNTIHRIWQEHQLKPHLAKTFKLSRDPKFVEKLTDVVGVYLTPPQNAVVLCVDEKSQIQALDRTQPGLPLKPGRCGTFTHDYKRNGTTTLFAALQMVEGRVIGECYPRHRHQEFLRFLRRLDSEFPDTTELHLILDNYGTHGHERVRQWLSKHPRFVLHFIPTSSSWLNLVERWFGELSQKAVRRGAFGSVADLERAIEEFMAAWNANPTPFIWTATVESILEKLKRCRRRLEQVESGNPKQKSQKTPKSNV
jgi:transposase/transcriptional regulator with XRE-family HTH domain